jgi:hypothetical protein
MQTHIRVLGILHIIFGAVGVLIGAGIFLFMGGIAGIVAMAEGGGDSLVALPILGGIGALVLIVMLVLSVPGVIIGAGLLAWQPWARLGMIILSVFHLANFPFGTALGAYGLWALLSAEGTAMFQSRTRYS